MASMGDRLVATLSDRYLVQREIGQGGMATVYVAHDRKHDRDVAIKVLHPDLAAALGSERFLGEIRTTARLQHPHILPLLDSGEGAGLLYYVMPFVAGESLRGRLEREKLLPIDDALRIAREVADALGYAHAHGIVHRDIKPENILLHGGHALVTDFGIALAVQNAGGQRLTQTGLSLGTPSYMSPEQAMGERSIDSRTDIYSLGCVLYEMLVGETPFTGNTVQAIVAKVLNDRPRPLALLRDTVPPYVEAAVHTALAKLPADRFGDASAFAAAIAAPAAHAPIIGAAPRSTAGRSVRQWQLVSGALGLTTLGLAAVLLMPDRGEPTAGVVRAEIDIGLTDALTAPTLASAPDGRSIVYCSGYDVWIRRWEDLSARRVPIGAGGCYAATFSPDGRQLAIIGIPNELRVVSLTGEAPPRSVQVPGLPDLPTYGGGIDWASDGRIYIASHGVLLRVQPDGSDTDVVGHSDSMSVIRTLDVLPDASASLIVFAPRASTALQEYRVGILDHESGRTEFILQGVNARVAGPEHLIVARDNGTLVAVPFDLRARRPRGPAIAIADSVRPDFPALDVTPEGTLVYWRSGEVGIAQAVLVDRSGSAEALVPPLSGALLTPRLSPNGSQLAVEEYVAGASDVWLRDLRTGQTTRLSSSGWTSGRPTWTPDGRALTFISDQRGSAAAYRRQLDDATTAALPSYDPRAVFHIEWSRDGAWLILRTDDQAPGKGDIVAVRPGVDSVAAPIVASPEFSEYSPSLSPDGRWLAYVSNQSGRHEVWVTTFPVPQRKWQVSSAGATAPLWSHSGRELFFVTEGHLVAATVTTTPTFQASPPRRLFPIAPFAEYGQFNRNYDVMPDDRRFLMLRRGEDAPTRLVMVLNWREQLRDGSSSPPFPGR